MDKLIFTLLMLFSVTVNARYRIVDLGEFEVDAINNNGEIAGTGLNEKGRFESFIYHSDTGIKQMIAIGADYSFSESINDQGEVVGYIVDYTSQIPLFEQSFLYKKESGMEILDLPDEYTNSIAKAINDKGQITGQIWRVREGTYPLHSFIYDKDNGFKIIEVPGGGGSTAEDINSNGIVVGSFGGASIYDENSGFKALGTLGGATSRAYAINSTLQVVGESQNSSNKSVAFLYEEDTGMIELGTLGGRSSSKATAINESGQIVGISMNRPGDREGFLYENGIMFPLMDLVSVDSSGWTQLASANDINDKGQIIGGGFYKGEPRAFLLEPVNEAIPVTVTKNLDIHFHSTILQSADGDQTIWANLNFDGIDESGDYYWRLDSYGEETVQPETFATVSPALDIQIQSAVVKTESGDQNIWANLLFVGSEEDGNFLWKLTDYGVNP